MVGEASGRMQKADCRDEIALPAAMLAWLKYRKQRTRNSRKRFLVLFCWFVKARVVYRLHNLGEWLCRFRQNPLIRITFHTGFSIPPGLFRKMLCRLGFRRRFCITLHTNFTFEGIIRACTYLLIKIRIQYKDCKRTPNKQSDRDCRQCRSCLKKQSSIAITFASSELFVLYLRNVTYND